MSKNTGLKEQKHVVKNALAVLKLEKLTKDTKKRKNCNNVVEPHAI